MALVGSDSAVKRIMTQVLTFFRITKKQSINEVCKLDVPLLMKL